jgi:peptide methionine sulfoxide reductase msrA/msrB
MMKAILFCALVTVVGLFGCDRDSAVGAAGATDTTSNGRETTLPKKKSGGSNDMVRVRVIGADGRLTPLVEVKKLMLSDDEWKRRLTPEQYRIGRNKGTEQAFCGGLLNNKEEGVYACMGCDLPLFASNAKFESGTGWPSFFQPIAAENIIEHVDTSHNMVRTEILCPRCDMHLGHVFSDGPEPSGLRYCLNSEVMKFVAQNQLKSLAESVPVADTQPAAKPKAETGTRAEAVFAGGCFWCVEAVFEEIEGVHEVISGYCGGDKATANYQDVCLGTTGHAEAVKIVYDPHKVTYEKLLKVHFATHDPTTLNQQGNDIGPQYRSAIFYADNVQRELARAFIEDLTNAKAFKKPIVTTVEPLKEFYPAEIHHQNYVCQNMRAGYVQGVALPKVAKVREKFKDLLKKQSPLGDK